MTRSFCGHGKNRLDVASGDEPGAYQVLKSWVPYQEPGADFYTRRESPEQKQAWLERQLQKLHPGCTITVTISPPEAALPAGT